jgi:hypothetical protein
VTSVEECVVCGADDLPSCAEEFGNFLKGPNCISEAWQRLGNSSFTPSLAYYCVEPIVLLHHAGT